MKRTSLVVIGVCCALIGASNLHAQHPITVQREAADGEYLRALVNFERLPTRVVTDETRAAAARSAWALGLTDRAIVEYDRILRDSTLSGIPRARVLMARAIIHYQEQRLGNALTDIERARAILTEPSVLRGRVLRVWGDILQASKLYGAAVERYDQALQESAVGDKPELMLALGRTLFRLGKVDEARQYLEQIPLQSPVTGSALRLLAEIALAQDRPTDAAAWLHRARADYPDEFLDSWVDYVFIRAAIAQRNTQEVRRLLSEIANRYPPSDYWRTLGEAAIEAFEWDVRSVRGVP